MGLPSGITPEDFPFVAITLALIATWLILYYAAHIQRILGEVVTDIMGKVLGMLLATIAIKVIWH